MTRRRPAARDVREAARGRWFDVFASLAPELGDAAKSAGTTKHHPCPRHGGKDGFRLHNDVATTGGAVCNTCGPLPNGFLVLCWLHNWTMDETIEKVAEVLGVQPAPPRARKKSGDKPKSPAKPKAEPKPKPTAPSPPADLVEQIAARAATSALARGKLVQRWQQGVADPGRIAAYLKSRGLSGAVPAALRYVDALDYFHDGPDGLEPVGRYPAILAMVQHPSLGLVALHRTYLDPGGVGKADVPAPKKLSAPIYAGATHGAAIRLFQPTGEVLAVAEGIETALAVQEATGTPCWVAVSAAGMAAVELPPPPAVRRVELWCDHDENEVGQKAAADAAARLVAQGYDVAVITPASPGDWLDVLNADGKDFILAAQASAAPFAPAAENLPEILIRTAEHEVADEAIRALEAEPALYQRGGALVHVIRDLAPAAKAPDAKLSPGHVDRPANSPRITAVPPARLRELLAKNARFLKQPRNGDEPYPTHPPQWLTGAVEARGTWPGIRRLSNVVECPTLRPDGSILDTPGFDDATGLLYEPLGDFLPIPSAPSPADAREAVAELLTVVSDFPFEKPAHRSAWLAALLTPLARFAFHGPAPLFLADANAAGVGKGKLLDVIGRVASGRLMARCQYSEDDAEMRKNITAVAISGELTVLLDNVAATLGGAALDAALTADSWNDRILGKSERTGDLPLYATWFATANNLALRTDTTRRVCHIRLSCPTENPEERDNFKHRDLIGHVAAHRKELLRAALVILRAYCVAGRPVQAIKPWGSFEGWSALVRAAIVWAGEPDPGDTRQELAKVADSQSETLRNLLTGWEALDGMGSGCTTAEALRRLNNSIPDGEPDTLEPLRLAVDALCSGGGRRGATPVALGKKLNGLRDRIHGGRFLTYFEDRKGLKYWYVKLVENHKHNGDQSSASSAAEDILPTMQTMPMVPPLAKREFQTNVHDVDYIVEDGTPESARHSCQNRRQSSASSAADGSTLSNVEEI